MKDDTIHILRNSWGYDAKQMRDAALDAADTIEKYAAEIDRLIDTVRMLKNGIKPVCIWLENGCDPKQAARELYMILER